MVKISLNGLDVVKIVTKLKEKGFNPIHEKSSLIVPLDTWEMFEKWFTTNWDE